MHARSVLYWKMKRTLAGPPNFIRNNIRNYKIKNYIAPYQITLPDHENEYVLY